MDKPLNLIVGEATEKIVKVVNEVNLPPFLLEPILREIYGEIAKLKQSEYEKSKIAYNQSKIEEEKMDG